MDAVYGNGRRRKAKDLLRDFLLEEDGLGTIEVVLILLVLIGLVVLFKDQLTSLVGTLLSKVTQQSNSI